MRIVPAQELENWVSSGRVLEKDRRGPKVIALDNQLFLKVFYTRRHPVLARLQPAARRFQRNTIRLRQLGIPSPEVREVFWLELTSGLSGCLYTPLPGESIENLNARSPDETRALLPALAAFIRTLHSRGIYFRSLHLGNILYIGDDTFGLIDVLDMQFKRRPLSNWLVRRNLAHLTQHLHRHGVSGFPLDVLLDCYFKAEGCV